MENCNEDHIMNLWKTESKLNLCGVLWRMNTKNGSLIFLGWAIAMHVMF